jgi:hypothetical protein
VITEDACVERLATLLVDVWEEAVRAKNIINPVRSTRICRFFAIDAMAICLDVCEVAFTDYFGHSIEVKSDNFVEVAHEENVSFVFVELFYESGQVVDEVEMGVGVVEAFLSE